MLTHILQFMSRADAQMRIMLKRIHMQNGYDQFIEGIEKLATETANDLSARAARYAESTTSPWPCTPTPMRSFIAQAVSRKP